MTRRWLGPLLGAVFLLYAAWITATRLEVTTDITHFLPEGANGEQAGLSRALAGSELTRTIVLTLGGADEDQGPQATAELADRISSSPEVAWLRQGVDASLRQTVHRLYYPRRFLFFSDAPEQELPSLLTGEGIRRALVDLKEQLRLAGGPIRSVAPADPFGGFLRRLTDLEAAQEGELELRGGQFLTRQGGRGVIVLGSRASAFDTDGQRRLQAAIGSAFATTNQIHGGRLVLEQSGAGRFAIASEESITRDITRISLLSTVGLLIIFGVLFRTWRSLLLLSLPLVSGVLGGLAVSLLIFGRIHGLTLAFGATLMGVCIDFAVHFQSHQALVPHPDGPWHTLRRIWPALLLGGLTTVAGLAGMAWTSLPGIREIAVFSSIGVIIALAATGLFLPALASEDGATPALAGMARVARRVLAGMAEHRWSLASLPAVALLCVVYLPRLSWHDDIKAFQNLDPELQAEQERVQRAVGQMEAGRIVVARGTSEEEALQGNDKVFQIVQAAQAEGIVDGFRSLHPFLWSANLQRRNWHQFATLTRERRTFEQAREAEGFRPDAFGPFLSDLEGGPPEVLRFADLVASPLADVVRPFRVTLEGEVAFITFLRGVQNPGELQRRLGGVAGAEYFDQISFLNRAYGQCRTRTFQLMVVGVLLVALTLLARYRSWRLTAAAFLPSLLAAAATLALVTAAGYQVNLLHLIGLLLVLSMGVDYGVFLVESRHEGGELAATTVAILVACLSTACAFGLLGLSRNPALRALGLTTGVGVSLSFLLAPTALLLARPGPNKERSVPRAGRLGPRGPKPG